MKQLDRNWQAACIIILILSLLLLWIDIPSTPPILKLRIKSKKLTSCIISCKLPLDLPVLDVAVIMPGSKFVVKNIQAGDTSANALPGQNAYHNFCNVEPTSMLWCVVQFKSFCQRTRFFSRERFIERGDDMRVKVVNNEFDFWRVWKMYRQ